LIHCGYHHDALPASLHTDVIDTAATFSIALASEAGPSDGRTSLLSEPVAQLDGDPVGALVHHNVLWFDVAMSSLCFQVEV
jgi:hypothetical protein